MSKVKEANLEMMKAIEEAEVKNFKSIAEYSKGTRALVREAKTEVEHLKNLVVQQNGVIDLLKKQISNLQIKTANIRG